MYGTVMINSRSLGKGAFLSTTGGQGREASITCVLSARARMSQHRTIARHEHIHIIPPTYHLHISRSGLIAVRGERQIDGAARRKSSPFAR
jgi:hypothetical protein